MDAALDPFPYGGATTSCEALIMGVPVITLAGQGMAGRLTSSILASADCQEWIAADHAAYVALAQSLAAAGQRDREQREQLRKKIQGSALSDGGRLCRELEKIYREAYRAKAIA
jgi:predicted O-linked N-acetylglucosamine transferase (SPINDLY family)